MPVQDSLLNTILLAKGIIHVRQLKSTRVLVIGHQRMQTSLCHWALLQTARIGTEDVTGHIRRQITTALSGMEVTKTFGAALAAINVLRLQRGGLESAVCSLRWKHIGLGAPDIANLNDFSILLYVLVHRCKRVGDAAGLENLMSNITVIQLRNLERALTLAHDMTRLGFAAIDSTNAKNVPGLQVGMLVLDWSSSINVVNVLLVTQETRRLWFNK